MMKGISHVITVLILILLTITLIGFSFSFFKETQEKPAEESEVLLKNVIKTINTQFFVESVSENHVYIRNKGSASIETDKFAFYVDNQQVNFTSDTLTLETGRVGTFILGGITESSKNLKVTLAGHAVYYPLKGVIVPPTVTTTTIPV